MIDGDRIRELRATTKLSQRVLGEKIGKDGQYVSKLERSILTNVTTDTLGQLAGALGCSTDYLLGRTDDPRPHHPRRPTAASVALRKHDGRRCA